MAKADVTAISYLDGAPSPCISPAHLLRQVDESAANFGWIDIPSPTAQNTNDLAQQLELPALLTEDLIEAGQRPKVERYGEALFVVLHPTRLESPNVEAGELHVVITEGWVATIGRSCGDLVTRARQDLHERPSSLVLGPRSVLLALIDRVVDDYGPVTDQLETVSDELISEVYSGAERVTEAIFEASRAVIGQQRAVRPVTGIVDALEGDRLFEQPSEQLMHRLRDIADHSQHITERNEALRDDLAQAINLAISLQMQRQSDESAQLTAASLKQAEDSRKIAAWAGVLFVPSLVAGTYGMNFHNMPELSWQLGYAWGLGLMFTTGFLMYLLFKWRRWL